MRLMIEFTKIKTPSLNKYCNYRNKKKTLKSHRIGFMWARQIELTKSKTLKPYYT